MIPRKKATIIVTAIVSIVILSAAVAQAARKPVAPSPVSFSLSLGGQERMAPGSKSLAAASSNFEYKFVKSYGLGVDLAYYYPFSDLDSGASDGIEDVLVYLADNKLWSNRLSGLNLTAKLSLIKPMSMDSKTESLRGGAIQSLILKKTFTDRLATTYTFGVTEYAYQYDNVITEEGKEISNTRVRILNKIATDYAITRDLSLMGGGSLRTYNNFLNQTYNIYTLITAINYKVQKNAQLSFCASSSAADPNAPLSWSSPAVDDNLFGAKGIILCTGMTFSI